jgi:signal transduction histidine kinase
MPDKKPARAAGRLDLAFRGLALLGVLALGALAADLALYPNGPGIAGQGLALRLILGLLIAPAVLLVGMLVVWRVPGNAVGRFLILIALGGLGGQFNLDAVEPRLAAWLGNLFIIFGAGIVIPSLGYLMLTFPDGHVHPPRLAPLVVVAAVVKAVGVALEVLASPGRIRIFTLWTNPLFIPALAPYRALIGATIGIGGVLLPAIWLGGIVSLVLRYRAAPERVRQQLKWVVWALAVLTPSMLLMAGGVLTGYLVAGWALPLAAGLGAVAMAFFLVALAVAILRDRLFDIEVILNRALVYAALTAGVVGTYVVIVGLVGELFHQSASLLLSLLASGLIAVLFQPVRERVQRAVNRLMYGPGRDEPYAVLSELGQRLEVAMAPEAVLPAIVETVAQALRLPYAAIALQEGDENRLVAEYGSQPQAAGGNAPVTFPLTYSHENIGQLRVAPRERGEVFTASEQRLLADIARQAGVAVHAARLANDLQRSRERLVTTREEERRRLRRDLHDGLGPQLASQTLTLTAASQLMREKPEEAAALLAEAIRHAQDAVNDIRRVVYELRPPALDDLGLAGALRAQAAEYGAGGLQFGLCLPDSLPPLPAAVEVACYRIAQEALTNVVRHAHAQHCWLALTVSAALTLEVADDGRGLAPDRRAGVGLASMRERAAELGGQCQVEPRPGGGTCILATLPLGQYLE